MLSTPVNATITDGTATGTITERGSSKPDPDQRNTNEWTRQVQATTSSRFTTTLTRRTRVNDASGGYGLFKMGADCSATPVLIGVIPNGTVIPARGHYLFVGSAYSLANYGGTGAAAGDQTLSSGHRE